MTILYNILTKPIIMEYHDAIAHGLVPNHEAVCIMGYNASYTTTFADITPQNVVVPLPGGAVAMEVISSNVADDGDPAGTGARTIKIYGLNGSGIEQNETKTLDGTNAVALSNTYLRINRAVITAVGTNGSAVGNISIRGAGGGSVYCYIAAGDNASMQCVYTVPAGKTAYLKTVCAGVSARETRVFLRATCNPVEKTLVPGVFIDQNAFVFQDSYAQMKLDMPISFPSLCDIKMSVKALAAGTGYTSASFQLYVEI